MATDEQRAAIERLRRWRNGEPWNEVYVGSHSVAYAQWSDDQMQVIDWCLAEHPADDGEPISGDFLLSLGLRRSERVVDGDDSEWFQFDWKPVNSVSWSSIQ